MKLKINLARKINKDLIVIDQIGEKSNKQKERKEKPMHEGLVGPAHLDLQIKG